MGSHLIDLLWFWLGFRKVYHVKGAMDVVVPTRIDSEGRARAVSTCGFFSCSIALEGNVDVQLSATTASLGQYRFDFHVYGTKGELHFDLVKKLKGAFLKERGIVRPIPVAGVMPEELDNRVPFFPGSFLYFAPRIVEAVLANNWQPITDATTFDQAVPTQRVLEAIRDSAMKGGCVCLNDGYQPGARF